MSDVIHSPSFGETDLMMSRRGFIKGLLGITAVLMIGSVIKVEPSQASTEHRPSDVQDGQLDSYQNSMQTAETNVNYNEATKEDESTVTSTTANSEGNEGYLDTTLKTGKLFAANYIGGELLKKVGIKTGNASILRTKQTLAEKEAHKAELAELPRGKVLSMMAIIVLGIPPLEEAIFRATPSLFANMLGIKGTNWAAGTATSALFARAHGFKNKDGDTILPVPQFTLGMLAWWLQRNRGYSHAVLAHSLTNVTAGLTVGAVYEKARHKAYKK